MTEDITREIERIATEEAKSDEDLELQVISRRDLRMSPAQIARVLSISVVQVNRIIARFRMREGITIAGPLKRRRGGRPARGADGASN